MEHQDTPIIQPTSKSGAQEILVLDKHTVRKFLIAIAIFFLLLSGGNLWTLAALQNRYSQALQKEIALLTAEVRQVHSVDPSQSKNMLAQDRENGTENILDKQPMEELVLAIDHVQELPAESVTVVVLVEPPEPTEQGEQNLAATEEAPVSSEETHSVTSDKQNRKAYIAINNNKQLQETDRENGTENILDEQPIEEVVLATDLAQELPAESVTVVVLVEPPEAIEQGEQNLAAAEEAPVSSEETHSVASDKQNRKAYIAVNNNKQLQETDKEKEAPVKHFNVKAKIKRDSRYSGGLFIASPGERNKEELQQEAESYLEKVENIPIGKPVLGVVGSTFGPRYDPLNRRKAFHSGIDFQGKTGDPIRTTADGIVVYSGFARDYGHHIIISHGQGVETLYAHMSQRLVEANRMVRRGQKIGLIGSTGRSSGPHLHYEIRHKGRAINPMKYIETAQSARSNNTKQKKITTKKTK